MEETNVNESGVEPNVDELISNLRTDTKTPLHIEHIKVILNILETSIKELKSEIITHDEHAAVLNKLELIKQTLSSDDLLGE